MGIGITGAEGTVDLDINLLAGNTDAGLWLLDDTATIASPMTADVSGLTTFGNGTIDLRAQEIQLNLDSSILGTGIDTSSGTSCTITRTRGPFTGGIGCGNYTTDADPGFVDAPGGDDHLSAGSPMIDAGNPAAPAAGALDIDARALDGSCPLSGPAVRDLGVDEIVPNCPPPPDTDRPDTFFHRAPKGRIHNRSPTFQFASDESHVTFLCRLDGESFHACPRVKTFHVKPGFHVVRVKAKNAAGNIDRSPARRVFVVLR